MRECGDLRSAGGDVSGVEGRCRRYTAKAVFRTAPRTMKCEILRAGATGSEPTGGHRIVVLLLAISGHFLMTADTAAQGEREEGWHSQAGSRGHADDEVYSDKDWLVGPGTDFCGRKQIASASRTR